MYSKNCWERIKNEDNFNTNYRNEWQRDYSRLIHSPSFRRLQGKTQLFPGSESEFFRNRLTHSIEVAQIGYSIAKRLNYEKESLRGNEINAEILQFAGLAHDLGHPPFGHQGEEALNDEMSATGGFEGNAQTLHILTNLEEKLIHEEEKSYGLNLTARSLASILKYDNLIPYNSEDNQKVIKGYYQEDKAVVDWIKESIYPGQSLDNFKTIECSIMDVSDDIAYSTYDLEDGLSAGFYTLVDLLYPNNIFPENIIDLIGGDIRKEIKKSFDMDFDAKSDEELTADALNEVRQLFGKIIGLDDIRTKEGNTYFDTTYNILRQFSFSHKYRSKLTSALVNELVNGVDFFVNETPAFSQVQLSFDKFLIKEYLKRYTYRSQIFHPRLSTVEFSGKRIVKEIFVAIRDCKGKVLPYEIKAKYNRKSEDSVGQNRIICNFISNMTDSEAIRFHNRLYSDHPESIFKNNF